jgi:hypothetical protein
MSYWLFGLNFAVRGIPARLSKSHLYTVPRTSVAIKAKWAEVLAVQTCAHLIVTTMLFYIAPEKLFNALL